MGRHSKLLLVYRDILISLVNLFHERYGRKKTLELAKLPEHDAPVWWRWRKGRRLFSTAIARKLVLLATRDSAIRDGLPEEMLLRLFELTGYLEQGIQEIVVSRVKKREADLRMLEKAHALVGGYDNGLTKHLEEFIERERGFLESYRARDSLVVSTLYDDAATELYFHELRESGAIEEAKKEFMGVTESL